MLNWIVSSSLLILAVSALGVLFRRQLSMRLRYALWGLVLLRLLCPLSIGQVPVSTAGLLARVSAVTQISDSRSSENRERAALPTLSQAPETGASAENNGANNVENSSAVTEQTGMLFPGELLLWLGGGAVLALVFLCSHFRLHRRLLHSRERFPAPDCPLPVYLSDRISSPCLFGLFAPKIYLTPETVEDETLLRCALTHELTHYCHRDHLWAVLRCVCLVLHWYNPLVWWAAFRSREDGELACDEGTVARLGEEFRAEYGRSLLRVTCGAVQPLAPGLPGMGGSSSAISRRIRTLVRRPKTRVPALAAVLLLLTLTAGCAFGGTGSSQPDTSGTAAETAALTEQPVDSGEEGVTAAETAAETAAAIDSDFYEELAYIIDPWLDEQLQTANDTLCTVPDTYTDCVLTGLELTFHAAVDSELEQYFTLSCALPVTDLNNVIFAGGMDVDSQGRITGITEKCILHVVKQNNQIISYEFVYPNP